MDEITFMRWAALLYCFRGVSLYVLYTYQNSIGSLIGEVFRFLDTGNIELLEANRNDGFAIEADRKLCL